MPLVQAKCTNCGADLRVDSSMDAAVCPYCGTPYFIENSFEDKYSNEYYNRDIFQSILLEARQYVELGLYEKAGFSYRTLSSHDPFNSKGYIGSLFCIFHADSYESFYKSYCSSAQEEIADLKPLDKYPDFLLAVKNANEKERSSLLDVFTRIRTFISEEIEKKQDEKSDLEMRLNKAEDDCNLYNKQMIEWGKQSADIRRKYPNREMSGLSSLIPLPIFVIIFRALGVNWLFTALISVGCEVLFGWMIMMPIESRLHERHENNNRKRCELEIERAKPALLIDEDIVLSSGRALPNPSIAQRIGKLDEEITYLNDLLPVDRRMQPR